VLGLPVQRVEVQLDGTVGLRTQVSLVVISAADDRAMLELQVPGGHWPRRIGRLPAPPGTELITTAAAGALLGVSPRTILPGCMLASCRSQGRMRMPMGRHATCSIRGGRQSCDPYGTR
jgi:hypothetical protein